MRFRPCIDIHNGAVKQIVGSSLSDENSSARDNFVSDMSAAEFARMYQKDGLRGGHIILLNKEGTEFFDATKAAAVSALMAYPGGMQIGGGINADNAGEYIAAGADKVIVTSYVFKDGRIDYENLDKLLNAVSRDKLVLDLSCKKYGDGYYIATDRWQKVTDEKITEQLLDRLCLLCSEFLIHAVDVEGKMAGIEEDLVRFLGKWNEKKGFPVTYAGGIKSEADIELIRTLGSGNIDFTVGSALDIFGGKISYKNVCKSSE